MRSSRFTAFFTVLAAFSLLFLVNMPAASADGSVPNPNETITTGFTATQLAQSLVGGGVTVSNATYPGAPDAAGHFVFTDPTVVGFGQGLVMSSGKAADVTGPNVSDSTSTDWSTVPPYGAGDADLDTLSGFTTFDASVLEFDFTPTANQVVFSYAFASDEYPEWVHTPYNDVFAFFVNGVNCATERQVAGDPTAPFVPVAVNNINNGNPLENPTIPNRPDLFRANYFGTQPPAALDLEQDGITSVLTCQSAVTPNATNHMKLAISDASDGVYDSAVFIQAGSLVSNENPVADLSVLPETGAAPLSVTAAIEGEDPNGQSLTYSLDWGDGTAPATGDLPDGTTLEHHVYTSGGHFVATLTVSNGNLSGTSSEDIEVTGVAATAPQVTTNPVDQSVNAGELFSFSASASGTPVPTVQWQVSTDGGATFGDIVGATDATYGGTATASDNGNLYQAVFTNTEASATTTAALLTVTVLDQTPPTLAPSFSSDPPFLRGATGITASANATDASGIASESCDPVDTTSVGAKTLTCRATDNAGNSASVDVDYVVGFGFAAVSPVDGATFKHTAAIPVSFQLVDANGVLSDADAIALKSSITVRFDGLNGVHPSYDKKHNHFSASLKTSKPANGSYQVTIDVVSGGATIAQRSMSVTIV